MAQRRSAERMDDASSLVSRVCEELIRAIQEPLSPPELAELVCGLDRSAAGLGLSIPGARRFPNQLEPTRHLILLQEMLSGLALKPKVFNGLYEIRKIFACLVIHLTKSR